MQKDRYGHKDKKRRLDEEVKEIINLSVFDESDPEEHQIKIMFGCGVYFGLRGNMEHYGLEVRNITHSTFPGQHSF